MDKNSIKLSAQRALLFNLSPSFRMISLEINEKILKVLIAVSHEPTEEEKELAYSFAGEIYGDFVEIKSFDVDFIFNKKTIDSLPRLDILIHAFYQ